MGDADGKLTAVRTVQVAVGPDGNFEEVEGSEKERPAVLTLTLTLTPALTLTLTLNPNSNLTLNWFWSGPKPVRF